MEYHCGGTLRALERWSTAKKQAQGLKNKILQSVPQKQLESDSSPS